MDCSPISTWWIVSCLPLAYGRTGAMMHNVRTGPTIDCGCDRSNGDGLSGLVALPRTIHPMMKIRHNTNYSRSFCCSKSSTASDSHGMRLAIPSWNDLADKDSNATCGERQCHLLSGQDQVKLTLVESGTRKDNPIPEGVRYNS